jgi:hypothetical protein
MAVAVIFGLAFATILTLVMVPTFFFMVHNARRFFATKILSRGYTESAFGTYIAGAGVIAPDAAEEALRVAQESGRTYKNVLVENSYITAKVLLAQLSDFVNYPVWEDLSRVAVTTRFKDAVPERDAREYKMAGFCSPARLTLFGPVGEPERQSGVDEGTEVTYLAVCEPLDPNHKENLRELTGMTGAKLVPVLSTREQVEALVGRTYAPAG